jgi:hypothetical protein
VSAEIEEILRLYAQHQDTQALPVTVAEARARVESLVLPNDGAKRAATHPDGPRREPGYLVEPDHPTSILGRPRPRRGRLIVVLAVAALIATCVLVTTRPGTHHPPSTVPPVAPPTTAAPATTQAAPPTPTATPLTASRLAQMLAAGHFAEIASEIEPPSRRSADQVILEQAWADLTNGYGTLLSTETQDEDRFPPPAPPDSPGGVVDETVLQMSHGLIMLGVTLNPDGALVHVEFVAQALVLAGPSGYIGPPLGF